MEKEILYRHFEGQTTEVENLRIMEWAERSSENYILYQQERKLWLAMLLYGNSGTSAPKVQRRYWSLQRFVAIAATVALLVIVTLLGYAGAEGVFVRHQSIDVPSGQRVELTLADGTHIWLNSKSHLEYSTLFGLFTRNVRLSGEGYFEVSHNRRKPFVVQTEDYDVRVLGTTFNVYAFDGLNKFETALIDGSVEVVSRTNSLDRLTLEPNQMAVSTVGGTLSLMPLEDIDRLRWIEGMICLNNVTFGELLERFSNCFDTEIRLKNPKLYNIRCTGKFRQSDGVEYSLNILQNIVNFEYSHDTQNHIIDIY